MDIREIPVPQVYKEESADFRTWIELFADALQRTQFDIEHMLDLYDPLRCPAHLLWMLADTMGFRYDDRLPTSFNRLVLVYFMSMIRLKGSKTGVMLAAEVNLKQFDILNYMKEHEVDDIYDNRLEDTTIPVNSVYVMPHVEKGYIDVVYYSENRPIDACIEYVRPLGMYLFQHAGVRMDAETKITVDARLTDTENMNMSIGPTHVGHYSREDYASLQKMFDEEAGTVNSNHTRKDVWYRNSDYEGKPDSRIDPGYRSLYSLQVSNNDHVLDSLMPNLRKIFSLGYGPQDVTTVYPDNYLDWVDDTSKQYKQYDDVPPWNLRYDRKAEEDITPAVYTVEDEYSKDILHPRPAVNPIMAKMGDAIPRNKYNTEYYPSSIDTISNENEVEIKKKKSEKSDKDDSKE